VPKLKKRTKAELTKAKNDALWENYIRAMEKSIAQTRIEAGESAQPKPAKLPKAGGVHVRSSYAYARAHRAVDKLIPADFASKDVDYTPGNIPALFDLKSTFSVKNLLEYIVIKREGKRECLLAKGFTKCCAPSAHCKRKRCAKCWALEQKQIKGVEYVVREVFSGMAAKIVDPFGVHPKGKRSPSKNMDLDQRAKFRLTSSQAHYKKGAADWSE